MLRNFLLATLFLLLSGCVSVQLFSGLEESDANLIVAALEEAGIQATKEAGREGVSVLVSKQHFARAVSLLDAQGLPPKKYETLGTVFEKSGFVSSQLEEQARYIYALSEELGNTISGIDNILFARVHIVMPETDVLGRIEQESSASVFIKYVEGKDIVRYRPYIRQLVSNAVTGLKFDRVSVIAVASDSTSMQPEPMMMEAPATDSIASRVVRIISTVFSLLALLLVSAWFFLPRVRMEAQRTPLFSQYFIGNRDVKDAE